MHVKGGRGLDPPGAMCACAMKELASRQSNGRPVQHFGPVRLGAAYPVFEMPGAGWPPLNDSLHRSRHVLVKRYCCNIVLFA